MRFKPPVSISTRVSPDVLLAVVVAILITIASLVEGSTWSGVLVGVGLCVPLVRRRRWPLGTLAIVLAGVPLYLAVAEPSPAYLPPVTVALYTVAVWGSRGRTLAVTGALVPFAAVIVAVFSPDGDERGPLLQLLEAMSQFALALAVGEAVRSQRAFVAATRDRAERGARERELETRQRLDEERVRIAQDVHDMVAHSIATISTQASVGVHVGRQEPAQAVEVLESIKAVSAQALHDLRDALGVLRDPSGVAPTAPPPSMHNVPALVERAREAGLAVELRMEGSLAPLSATVQVAIYRIVQEGLTNVMRHAGGAHVTVRIAVRGQVIEVDVSDDGRGAPTPSSGSGSGSGLVGMRERASAMGGELETGRGTDGGFRVRALLPVDRGPA